MDSGPVHIASLADPLLRLLLGSEPSGWFKKISLSWNLKVGGVFG
jgi:hypothetical protein